MRRVAAHDGCLGDGAPAAIRGASTNRDFANSAREHAENVSTAGSEERTWPNPPAAPIDVRGAGRRIDEHRGQSQAQEAEERDVKADAHRTHDKRGIAGLETGTAERGRVPRTFLFELAERDRDPCIHDRLRTRAILRLLDEPLNDVHISLPKSAYRRNGRADRALIARD